MRTIWLVIAFLLAVGLPFYAFGLSTLDFVPALLVSLIALVLAGFAVRQSARSSRD